MKTWSTTPGADGLRLHVTRYDVAEEVLVTTPGFDLLLSYTEAEELALALRAAARPFRRASSRNVSEMTLEEAAARWAGLPRPAGTGEAS